MNKIKLADYLFGRIKAAGVEFTFGIPGDFVLPHYAAQARVGLKTVVMTHEPSVGFAADAYARVRGLGAALVTYGAGGLNMINPVGLAYAEESPLLVVSGGPETRFRSQKPELHHCIKTFDTQFRIYREVTAASTLLSDPRTAQHDIDLVFDTMQKQSRPGYIEFPRDLVNVELEPSLTTPSSVGASTPALRNAAEEIIEKLHSAKHPVLFTGVHVQRLKLIPQVVALAEALNIPVVTSILGKASFPEFHPNFIGTYFGQFANPKVCEYVESSDCVLCLGVVLTEMETGGYTAKLEPGRLVHAAGDNLSIGHHNYPGVALGALIDELLKLSGPSFRFQIPKIEAEDLSPSANCTQLTVAGIITDLNQLLADQKYIVVSDVGDCLYAGLSLKTDTFIAPGYYSSMGFGVPAAIGAQLALPEKRPVVLVGDGAFQMTGTELCTAAKLGLNPIIVVFNNSSYAMLRFIDQQREYYKLPQWNYAQLANALGGGGVSVNTRAGFQKALAEATRSDNVFLIDAVIAEDDISPTLRRLTNHFGKKVKASIS